MPDNSILEYQFWSDLIQSHEFKYLQKAFIAHKVELEKDVVRSVRDNKPTEAIRAQAKAEDMNKIIGLMEHRLAELKSEGGE